MVTKKFLDKLTYDVIGAAIEVHKYIGAGLLESVYHDCLKYELSLRNINFLTEMIVPVHFKGLDLETDLRCDLFVENCLVIELKAVSSLAPIHEAQLLTYEVIESPERNFDEFQLRKPFQRRTKNICE